MRRLSLSAKLFAAVLPLLVAVGALLTLSIRGDFGDVAQARRGAQLGSTWEPLVASIHAVESEHRISIAGDQDAIVKARRATDSSMTDLHRVVQRIGDSDALILKIGSATKALSTGRDAVDSGDETSVTAVALSYDTTERHLISLGRQLPDEASDAQLGRTLLAVAALAATEQSANDLVQSVGDWPASEDPSGIVAAALLGDENVANLADFDNAAPDEWLAEFRGGRFRQRLTASMNDLDAVVAEADDGTFVAFDTAEFDEIISGIATTREKFAAQIVVDADSEADSLQQATLLRIGITLVAVLLAAMMALFFTRSITRRVRAVSDKAREVASIQLPALVSALRDPRGLAVIPEVAPIEHAGSDELGELADAFNMVQSTLVDVAHQQVEVLRRGVSNIFVTMARRTRSLIDRQLALLDKLEADVDDPAVLANYYQLDHLATRMRRNSESLLVLANAESRRRRTQATEVDDVVRAAVGEVEDYRRIDVLNLDHLQVRGSAVADISHLLAELLDNASSFSPPESRVTVSGRYAEEHYLISIVDEGVGIGTERLQELNDILAHPPIVGLSVERTLGMSVVSLLANKHGVQVRLLPSSGGLLVEVFLPASVYADVDPARMVGVDPTTNGHDRVAPDSVVDWMGGQTHADPSVLDVASVEPPAELVDPTFEPEPTFVGAEPTVVAEPPVEPEWTFQAEPATGLEAVLDAATTAPEPAAKVDPWGFTPPQSHDRLSGEFDRMPAPPVFATPPVSRPFTDPAARPIPARRTESERPAATNPSNASLPTRARGTGPDGPDRLAHLTSPDGQPTAQPAPTTPSSLRASLNAFEAGRAGARPSAATPSAILPTRDPGSAFDHDEVTPSTTQSRLDPEAIRERLRSFQQEFQLGRDGEGAAGHDGDQTDLGGDR